MSDAQTLPGFEPRPEPGRGRAIGLSLLVHLVLVAVLFLGVRWQSSVPSTVTVELWAPQPTLPAAVLDAPKPEPVAAPPKPVEAKVEPPLDKPDIALKAPKAKRKPKEKKESRVPVRTKMTAPADNAKVREEDFQRELRAQLAREEARMAAERQSEELRQLGRQAEQQAKLHSAALARERADYIALITGKVRGNWILPQQMEGNPEAVFLVTQLPTGEVMNVKLAKSSGLPAYDAAVERAILKSSPLPVPRSRELFARELKLTFKPRD
ncbi:MAG: TonB C-terminal domain-containing protein [Betaproteobacteria bacterium]|nr:TonB C-terminal domain-containing protein [Betaproteobacteria bacterium]